MAIAKTTRLTFAFRQDNYYFALDDVTVSDNAAPGNQLILNGGFETGNLTSWVYCNPSDSYAGGLVQAGNFSSSVYTYAPYSGTYFYLDGAEYAPDYLSQTFTTTIGNTYTIAFSLFNPSDNTTLSIDVLMST
jgi:hypothetical protein